MVNTLLDRVRALLKNELGSEFLYPVEENVLPQYSDVVLILSQYDAALKEFKTTHYNHSQYRWNTLEEIGFSCEE